MHRTTDRSALATLIAVLATPAACGDGPIQAAVTQEACAPDGSLSVALHGGIRADIDWQGADLECSGMPRPNGAGARLRFAGSIEENGEKLDLAFVIGLPELSPGAEVNETPANVTLVQEGGGRFFSSAEAPICWSDIAEQSTLAANEYAIRGIVYCVSPLPELNGSGGVSFTELGFSGRVNWDRSQ